MQNTSVDQLTPNAIETDPLLIRQQEIEEEGVSMGADRFERRLRDSIKNGTVADSGAAKKLLELGMEKFTGDLVTLVKAYEGRKGARPVAIRWINKLGADKAAYITLRSCFHSGLTHETVPKASKMLGKRISDELRFRHLEAEAPGLFKYRMSQFATNHYMHRSRALDAVIRYADIDTSALHMDDTESLNTGTFLINALIESTGFFEVDHRYSRGKTQVHLVPTAETSEWLTQRNDALRLLSPVYPAMVVQPLPWSKGKRGGYRYALRGGNHLVRGARRYHKGLIDNHDMPAVYQALNLIQNTEWVVNKPILNVVSEILSMGGGKAGLPKTEPVPETPKKGDEETNPDSLRKWKKAETKRREEDNKRVLECLRVNRIRETAVSYAEEERIYFPHSLDFRGRIYPITTDLSPQGDDLQKALLKFATGKPLGSSGAKYLAIHGANAWGKLPSGQKVSKLTLEEREAAILEHSEWICSVAQDPTGNPWWMDADEPWCFLAFCHEWLGYVLSGMSPTFVSSLPVASDGTCNGLQHFAALLRDPVAAEAVNVVDNQRPNDIYQTVADVVLKKLEAEAATNPLALQWLESGLVNRSLTKRPTMTLAYGAKQFGFADQLKEYLKGLEAIQLVAFEEMDEKTGELKVDTHKPCVYMASLIWHSLGDVVVSAQEGMAYFQKYARGVAKGNLNPTWVVPGSGFLAYQNSFKEVSIKSAVKTILCGKAYCPSAYRETTEVDPVKAANGISPNIIHSLDAAALMLTVNRAADCGVTHFAMVHDSYGTHAADAELLNHELRQAFFGLYKEDVLGALEGQFVDQIEKANEMLQMTSENPEKAKQVEVPEAPLKGTLDLSRVLISNYFFC